MNQQQLNLQFEQYLLGNLSPAAVHKLTQSVSSHPDFLRQWMMCQQVLPYINGELFGNKLVEFEKYLTQNSFLNQQVQVFEQGVSNIQEYGKDDLLQYLTRFDKELDDELLLDKAAYEAAFEDEELYLSQIPVEIDENGELVFLNQEEEVVKKEAKKTRVGKVVPMSPVTNHKKNNKSTFSWRPLLNIAAILLVLLIPAYLFFFSSSTVSDSQQLAYNSYEKLKIADSHQSTLQKAIKVPAHASGDPINNNVEEGKNITLNDAQNNEAAPKKQKPFYEDVDEKANNLDITLSKANTAYQKNNFEKAAQLFEKVAKDSGDSPQQIKAKLYAGNAWLGAKNPQKALPLLEQLAQNPVSLDPSNIQWNLGLAYLQANQNEKAKAIFQRLAKQPIYASKVADILGKMNEITKI